MALQAFGPGMWLAEGQPVSGAAGFVFPTRMAVMRVGDGLALWSPVQPLPALRDAVSALGAVRWLVAPNRLHHLFLGDWAAAFPAAEIRAAPGLAEAMRLVSPLGRLSRGIAGTVGTALVLNVPGSPKGAVECVDAVLDVVPHALALLAGDQPH